MSVKRACPWPRKGLPMITFMSIGQLLSGNANIAKYQQERLLVRKSSKVVIELSDRLSASGTISQSSAGKYREV
jgi:hypothetical protein